MHLQKDVDTISNYTLGTHKFLMQLSERFVHTATTIRGIITRTHLVQANHHSEVAQRLNRKDRLDQVVILNALHQAFLERDNPDKASQTENDHFGELKPVVERIIHDAQHDGTVAVDRMHQDRLADFIDTPRQTADLAFALKEHGFSWLPKELLNMGKYVALAVVLIGVTNDPLRGVFFLSLADRIEEHHLPVVGFLYAAGIAAVTATEIRRLYKGAAFVANPYVTLWAMKFRPELASTLIRTCNSLYDLFVLKSIRMSGSAELAQLLGPLLLFSAAWTFGEAGLNIFLDWFSAKKKRTVKKAAIHVLRTAKDISTATSRIAHATMDRRVDSAR